MFQVSHLQLVLSSPHLSPSPCLAVALSDLAAALLASQAPVKTALESNATAAIRRAPPTAPAVAAAPAKRSAKTAAAAPADAAAHRQAADTAAAVAAASTRFARTKQQPLLGPLERLALPVRLLFKGLPL